jgi:hypothetical protein
VFRLSPSPSGLAALAAWGLAVALALAGCGASTAPPSPTPTPLPVDVLQQRFLAAAAAFEAVVAPVAEAQTRFCGPSSATPDLTRCASALSDERQARIVFDDAIRRLRVAGSAQPAMNLLLGDDSRLEALLLQASTAPSLTAVSGLTPQLTDLVAATQRDADALRRAIGLRAASATPSPTTG